MARPKLVRSGIVPVALVACINAILGSADAQGRLDEDDVNAIIQSLAPTLSSPGTGPSNQRDGASTSIANDALTSPLSSAEVAARTNAIVIQRPLEITIREEIITIDADRAIDLEVFFRYDSDELTPQAIGSLQSLGQALAASELRPFSYLVAGHTDASGAASYNRDLSMRRADAVRNYLVRQFAIDPERLLSIGFGEDRLRTPAEPLAAINRRVEIALIARRPDQVK